MTQLIIVVVAVAAVVSVVWLVARKRAAILERETVDLYGHYVAGIRELTQAYLLQAPSDEEWLAEIKARGYDAAEMPPLAGNVIRLPAASGSAITQPARPGPARLFIQWALMLTGAAVTLAVPAVAVFFAHPTSAAGAAYLILAAFLGGVAIGVVAMVAIAVRQEDRLYTLSAGAPVTTAYGYRWLTGYGAAGWHQRPRNWER